MASIEGDRGSVFDNAVNFLTDAIGYLRGEREGASPEPDAEAALDAISEAEDAIRSAVNE